LISNYGENTAVPKREGSIPTSAPMHVISAPKTDARTESRKEKATTSGDIYRVIAAKSVTEKGPCAAAETTASLQQEVELKIAATTR
jgi:hypothetical protein